MLDVTNLTCVRGDRRLFSDLNFAVTSGKVIEVRGPNGSGKTSLLRIICGLASPASGEVRWNETNIQTLGEDYFGSVAYVAHQNGVKDELSVIENLLFSTAVAGARISRQQANTILERVGLERQRDLPVRFMSAGQRRRLAMSRLLAGAAPLWVLDEVTSSLDEEGLALAAEMISEHLASGGLAVISAHQDFGLDPASITRIELLQ